MYSLSQGDSLDDVESHAWLSIAAAQGNKRAQQGIDVLEGAIGGRLTR